MIHRSETPGGKWISPIAASHSHRFTDYWTVLEKSLEKDRKNNNEHKIQMISQRVTKISDNKYRQKTKMGEWEEKRRTAKTLGTNILTRTPLKSDRLTHAFRSLQPEGEDDFSDFQLYHKIFRSKAPLKRFLKYPGIIPRWWEDTEGTPE